MADATEVWGVALPKVREGVTGVGVWTSLNQSIPVTIEDDIFVLGSPQGQSELAGHLRVPAVLRLIEQQVSAAAGKALRARVIDGTDLQAWELVKRRDAERRRMQDAEMTKMRLELDSKKSWDQVYESLSRRYAAIQNKSLPQNRARFFEEAVEIVVEARKDQTEYDDLAERNFARCLERVAQYCDLPAPLVASEVLKRSGEL